MTQPSTSSPPTAHSAPIMDFSFSHGQQDQEQDQSGEDQFAGVDEGGYSSQPDNDRYDDYEDDQQDKQSFHDSDPHHNHHAEYDPHVPHGHSSNVPRLNADESPQFQHGPTQTHEAVAAPQTFATHEYSSLGRQIVEGGHSRLAHYAGPHDDHDRYAPAPPAQSFAPPRAGAYPTMHQRYHPSMDSPTQGRTVYNYSHPQQIPGYVHVLSSEYDDRYDHRQPSEPQPSPDTHRAPYWPTPTHPHLPLPVSPPQPRAMPFGTAPRHVYTPYAGPGMPSARVEGPVGGRDGWGPAPGDGPQHYTAYPAPHAEDDYHLQPTVAGGPGHVQPAYVNPSSYSGRPGGVYSNAELASNRFYDPLSPPTTHTHAHLQLLAPSTAKKSTSKPRKPTAPPKPRQLSKIYHPSPQAMLAPHLQAIAGAATLTPRLREGDKMGTNAPALPSDDEFRKMFTKRSRGRRPPGAPDLDLSTDPNLAPSKEQIEYAGLTKTGKAKRLFLCKVPDCGRVFKRSEHLKRHVRSIHTNMK